MSDDFIYFSFFPIYSCGNPFDDLSSPSEDLVCFSPPPSPAANHTNANNTIMGLIETKLNDFLRSDGYLADYLGVSVFVFFSADYWNLQNYFLCFNSNIALSQTQKIIIRWRRWNFVAMVEVEGKKVALGYRIIWASFIFPRYFILKRFSLLWKKMSIILWFLIFLGKCFLKTKDIKKIYEEYKINSYIKKHIRKTTIQAWCWHVILLVFFKWRIT